MADIKAYRPSANSLGSGQVLMEPYDFGKARLIVKEMTDQLALDLVEKRLVTDQLVLAIGYDTVSLSSKDFKGEVKTDWYGRKVPKSAHGSINLDNPTASTRSLTRAMMQLYDRIADPALMVRRIGITAAHVVEESKVEGVQLQLFENEEEPDGRERSRQEAILEIRRKFGKNAILKGMDFEEGATTRDRNKQIGGHKA